MEGCGSATSPFGTIQAAVDAAAPGERIVIAAGQYQENVVVPDSLVLEGTPGAVLLAGVESLPTLTVERGTVRLEGLTVGGASFSSAVYLSHATREVGIYDCELFGSAIGLEAPGTLVQLTVQGSTLRDNTSYGAKLDARYGSLLFTENDVLRNADAIAITDVWTGAERWVYANNFIDNDTAVPSEKYVRWQGSYESGGNYWSDWTAPDVNGDYTVDEPYYRDHYPLTEPSAWELRDATTLEESIQNGATGVVYYSIAQALEEALPGEEIVLAGGTIAGQGQYAGNFTVPDGVSLRGEAGATIWAGAEQVPALTVERGTVRLEGLTVGGASFSSAVYLSHATRKVGIYDCELFGSAIGLEAPGMQTQLTVQGSTIRDNTSYGAKLDSRYGSLLFTENDVLRNADAIAITDVQTSAERRVYHNNFVDNESASASAQVVTWDDGYPSGGNHWSEWLGPDVFSGPGQDQPGEDGIVDAPYGHDRFPLADPEGWVPTNQAPVADAGPDVGGLPDSPYVGEAFTLDASGSYDIDGEIVRYEWLLPDGTVLVEATGETDDGIFDGRTSHVFDETGTHTVHLTVTDEQGATGTDAVLIHVSGFGEGVVVLLDHIRSLELPRGATQALEAKVLEAQGALRSGDVTMAVEALEDVRSQLSAPGFCKAQATPELCAELLVPVERLLAALGNIPE